jgi:NAD(P)-dependent dehydrogenase (short-subunit alcohol dehydrogenase family)
MDPNTRFKMKPVALITGGSRGIGLGIAQALVKQGYRVAINGVRAADQVVEPLKQLNAEGGEAIYCQGNVGSADDRRKIMEDIKAKWGQLNLLVNNAGVAPKERKDILEADEQSFDWLMGINLKGPYFLTQQAANWMIEQKTKNSKDSFSIINISSVSATIASVNRGEYCISKAGMSMSTKLWAARLGEFDIPVYEIQPGVILTDMTAGVIEKYDKMIAAGLTLQRRWGQPEDLGKTVIALAEGMIPYATGQIIHTDGGMTIQTL